LTLFQRARTLYQKLEAAADLAEVEAEIHRIQK
jgi:hypothetical protein